MLNRRNDPREQPGIIPPVQGLVSMGGRERGGAAKGKSSMAVLGGLCNQHVLDGGQDALLLTAWQPGNRFKGLPDFPGRASAASFWGGFAKELIYRSLERISKRGQLIGAQSSSTTFPIGDHLLIDAEFVRKLLLGKAGMFAQGGDALAKRGALPLGRSAGLHTLIIRVWRKSYRNCLHSYRSIL